MQENYKQKVIDFFDGRTSYDLKGDSHLREAKRLLEYVGVKSIWTNDSGFGYGDGFSSNSRS